MQSKPLRSRRSVEGFKGERDVMLEERFLNRFAFEISRS